MKPSRAFMLLLGSTALLSASAFAGNTNKKSLHLFETVTIQGKQLPAGDYRLEWSGTGSDVTVSILRGKETLVTAPARVVAASTAYKQSGYTAEAEKDGSRSVTDVFFSGDKFDIELGSASNASTTPGAATSGTN
ncbi:MAG: hypothetical protein WA857_09410 [Candidatus Acidiferrum sp.]